MNILDAFNRPLPPGNLTRTEWEKIVEEAIDYIYEAEIKTDTALEQCNIVSDLLDRNNLNNKQIWTLCSIAIESTELKTKKELVQLVADNLAAGASKIGDYYAK